MAKDYGFLGKLFGRRIGKHVDRQRHAAEAHAGGEPIERTGLVPMELTSDWSENDKGEYTATAKFVILNTDTGKYEVDDDRDEQDVYDPCADRDAQDLPIWWPIYGDGKRIWCVYRGRWEMVSSGETLLHVEVKEGETLEPGGGSVICRLHDDPEEPEITVYEPDEGGGTATHRFGVARGGSGPFSQAGTHGWAIFNPRHGDNGRWEFVALNAKTVAFAVVIEAGGINPGGNAGTVEIYWKKYDGGGIEGSSIQVEAWLWAGPKLVAGDPITISYDRHEGYWYVIDRPGAIIVKDGGAEEGNPIEIIDFRTGLDVGVAGDEANVTGHAH